MVLKQTNRRKTIGKLVLSFCLISIATFFALGVLHVIKNDSVSSPDVKEPPVDEEKVVTVEEEKEEVEILPIDFQHEINDWVNSTGGTKGIAIYDLDLDTYVGSYNIDEKFETASVYKLFVVYEGYRRVQSGEWNKDETVSWTGNSILECLDLAIRESNSPCAETLWSMIGRDELNDIVHSTFELSDVFVNDLEATPSEIVKMLKIYYEHKELTDDTLVTRMKDSFLNQPVTEYNWRQGLPSGFSERALVYNKVGWNYDGSRWTIYDDVAIVEFPEQNRRFIVVVMTSGVNFQQIRNFATILEEKFFSMY